MAWGLSVLCCRATTGVHRHRAAHARQPLTRAAEGAGEEAGPARPPAGPRRPASPPPGAPPPPCARRDAVRCGADACALDRERPAWVERDDSSCACCHAPLQGVELVQQRRELAAQAPQRSHPLAGPLSFARSRLQAYVWCKLCKGAAGRLMVLCHRTGQVEVRRQELWPKRCQTAVKAHDRSLHVLAAPLHAQVRASLNGFALPCSTVTWSPGHEEPGSRGQHQAAVHAGCRCTGRRGLGRRFRAHHGCGGWRCRRRGRHL